MDKELIATARERGTAAGYSRMGELEAIPCTTRRSQKSSVSEVWIADALKDGHRWVVGAPTPPEASGEILITIESRPGRCGGWALPASKGLPLTIA